MSFWEDIFNVNKRVVGLSPMDGVSDAAFRYMVGKYGRPDVMFTEFVSVDALHYATGERRERLLKTFVRARDIKPSNHYTITPFEVAQVFGHTPEFFAEAAVLVESLGFDGIDINMGCPAHNVEEQGSGAGLIRTPKLAQELIRVTREATVLPVSVKTRIGIKDKSEMEEWIMVLMEAKPVVISLHGRTLRQLYQGKADWETIGRAGRIVHKMGGHILGNGDMTSLQQAAYSVEQYGVDGVLIGRAAEGNPGIFAKSQISNSQILQLEPTREQRLAWAVEHAKIFEKIVTERVQPLKSEQATLRVEPSKLFMPMRKHLAWYCRGFPGAVELRMKLMQANSADEVELVLKGLIL
ncbi:MAG: tRNA-dihydrouridine synthase [bacterium]